MTKVDNLVTYKLSATSETGKGREAGPRAQGRALSTLTLTPSPSSHHPGIININPNTSPLWEQGGGDTHLPTMVYLSPSRVYMPPRVIYAQINACSQPCGPSGAHRACIVHGRVDGMTLLTPRLSIVGDSREEMCLLHLRINLSSQGKRSRNVQQSRYRKDPRTRPSRIS